MKPNSVHNGDCLELMKDVPDGSVDCILTDPPYKYLKNQKLETDFDEEIFFTEGKRILKKGGFIVLFGRGSSFYRWNTILDQMKFIFKEEIIWNKSYCTSPLMDISRVHETISLHCNGKGKINKVKIPYLEMKGHDIDSIVTDIKRLKAIFKNTESLDAVISYLESNYESTKNRKRRFESSVSSEIKTMDRGAAVMSMIEKGMNEKSIIRDDFYESESFTKFSVTGKRKDGDRCVKVINSISQGMNEKSIIKEVDSRYDAIHPTQKPVRLLERLLALATKEGDAILDPFAGSHSTAIACMNTNRSFITMELDKEYFEAGKERIEKHKSGQTRLAI